MSLRRRSLPALLALFAPAALAASISVKPIRLELEPGQASASLTVSDEGEESKLLQVSVVGWTRADDADRYAPADDTAPLATPPLFRVSAGASQIVRIGFGAPPAPAATERAWRIVVDEVPEAAPASTATQVRIRLRISVPYFVPPAAPRRELRWEALPGADGRLRLVADNRGNVHERFDRIELLGSDGKQLLAALPGPIYVFPGERRMLAPALQNPAGSAALRLSVQSDAGTSTVDLRPRAQ